MLKKETETRRGKKRRRRGRRRRMKREGNITIAILHEEIEGMVITVVGELVVG